MKPRNSAPISKNRPAALTKARIRKSTECTGFLARITASADRISTVEKSQKNIASACIVCSLLFPFSALAGEGGAIARRNTGVLLTPYGRMRVVVTTAALTPTPLPLAGEELSPIRRVHCDIARDFAFPAIAVGEQTILVVVQFFARLG